MSGPEKVPHGVFSPGSAKSSVPPVSANPLLVNRMAAAIVVAAIVARLVVSWRTHAVGEDALITLRYAENIAAGHGWVYNPGERVLGTTTPLFTLILALAALVRLPALAFGVAVSIIADGVTCWLIARLMARPEIRSPIAGLFAAMLYAFSSTPISITISGMETALVTCIGVALIHAYVAGHARVLCILGAVLFLLRIDGLMLFGLLFLALIVRTRRVPWDAGLLFLAIALPWILFAWAYFGSPIPSSVIAKLTVYSHSAWSPGSFTNTVAFNGEAFRNQFTLGWPQRIITLLFCVGAIAVVRDSIFARAVARSEPAPDPGSTACAGRGLGVLLPPLIWLLIYYGTMFTSHVPAFPWYFLPPWPLFIALTALGAATLVRSLLQRADRGGAAIARSPRVWGTALALFGAFGLVHVPSIMRDISRAQEREDTLRRPLGIWLRDHVAPNERVLLEPIGYAGYYSRTRILDMVGLVSPEVLPYYRSPAALSGIVRGLRPEWLCLRASERDLLHAQDPGLPEPAYTFVQVFPSAGDPAFYVYHRR